MSPDTLCPNCSKPIGPPALDEAANCPHCGVAVRDPQENQVQPGMPEIAPAPSQALRHRLPRRSAVSYTDWGAENDFDVRIPVQPPELRTRTYIAVALIALVLVADLAIGCAELFRFSLLQRVGQVPLIGGARPVPPDRQTELETADQLCLIAAGARNVFFLVSLITYLVWIYRAYCNLTALRVAGLNHSPGWAVALYFVPIVNLARGCTVLQEIWKGSDPTKIANELEWKTGNASVVALWWFLYMATVGVNSIGQNMMRRNSMEAFASGEKCTIAAAVLSILCGLLLIRILLDVAWRQEHRYAALRDVRRPA
jgi:hypothetical protein